MVGVHQIGALLSAVEEGAIDEGEGENLARAILDVAKQRKRKPNKDLLAWGNFATVVLTLYLPRAIAILAKRRAARHAGATLAPPIIVDIDANGNLRPQVAN